MMLQALYELARRKKLLEDPDYEKKRVDFILGVASDGRFLGLQPTRGDGGRADERDVPRMPTGRTVGIAPGFLFDKAQYVLGLGAEGAKKGRNELCVAAFRALIDDLAKSTADEGALAVARFYARRADELPKILKERSLAEWTGSELIAFQLNNDDDLVHHRPAIRAHWARLRNPTSDVPETKLTRCLVTGEIAPAAQKHNSIKRVPEAQSSGASLVSFNADAFSSQGLDQGENAPISRAAAEGYATALNWLLEGTDKRRFKYGVPLGQDAVTVFWTREDSPLPDIFADIFAPPPAPTEKTAIAAAESPWTGLEPAELDESHFYALTLSGNAARVVVRDWFEATVGDVKHNLKRYFDDLRLGQDEQEPLSIYWLLKALESPGGRGLSPDLGTKLFGAALQGRPFPRELLSAALRRLRLPPDKNERLALRARCSLIKAVLSRSSFKDRASPEVKVSLDEKNTHEAYLLGRLFAVLERLQGAALGDINASIRDKFFGSASSTPALVFPRLIRLSVHHVAKAGDGAGWLEKLKGQIIGALPASPFPRTLSLDNQGLFAIGYYHQRERFFRPSAAKEETASESSA